MEEHRPELSKCSLCQNEAHIQISYRGFSSHKQLFEVHCSNYFCERHRMLKFFSKQRGISVWNKLNGLLFAGEV